MNIFSSNEIISVYILIPVHNRKDITLRCLDHLRKQEVLLDYKVVIIDDGSTDDTSIIIAEQYPEVILIKGDGNLWWTGAIRKGMECALSKNANYFVWMNDDVIPSFGTLQKLVNFCIHTPNSIVSGQCYEEKELQTPTYGGQKKGFLSNQLFHTPIGEVSQCDFMSGNLVCFPKSIIDKIGFPQSDYLPHNLADIVYTWEAKKAGYQLLVYGDASAICKFNPYEEGFDSSTIPMRNRWKLLKSYKSNLYPPAFWYYCKCFYGILAPLVFFKNYLSLLLYTILRIFFPLSLIRDFKISVQNFLYRCSRKEA
jgi:GT2 family glycosyltransferase